MKNLLDQFILNAIEEDISQAGDLTSLATIPKDQIGTAQCLVKENCVIAGIEMAKCITAKIDPALVFSFNVNDGDKVEKMTPIGTIEGSVQSILLAERLLLNCMQRMSGIATKVDRIKNKIKQYPAIILDTRKTTPNFRMAEKWAVRIGGGENHRFGLYDMILIKDNHIQAAGSVSNALQATIQFCKTKNLSIPVVIEVKNRAELETALQFDIVDRILLDNMTPKVVEEMISINQGLKPLEVSGGICEDNIEAYAATGVDYISMGDLTHHIQSIDISLKLIKNKKYVYRGRNS